MTSFETEPATISHYQLEHMLARGGMSLVYLARNIHTNQQVALKLVHAIERDHYQRFRREASTLASMANEHILPVIDYGEHGSWFYMTTPYIEYGSLRDRLAKGTLSIQEAEEILVQLVDAVQYAHDRGIVHRDIKPSNILLRDGHHVYLADFGLVKHVEERSDLTQTGCMLGTPEYMAPELAERPATSSSDIYALGIVLYYMLTGHIPFTSNTPLGVYWKHLHEIPVAPSIYQQTLSPAVDAVILRTLAKKPEQRFQSAKDLLEAYQAAIKNEQRITVTVVKVDHALSAITTRKSLVIPHKNKMLLHKRRNMRVGALVILTASFLFALAALLHFSLPYTYNYTETSVIHASGPIFHNRVQTATPSVQPTSTGSNTPINSTDPSINKTSFIKDTGSNGSGSNTGKSNKQTNHNGKGKHQKNKPKHGHGGKNK